MSSSDVRAFISLAFASAVPGILTLAVSQGKLDLLDELLRVAIWWVFSLFVVLPTGMAAYYILRRSRIPFLLSAPVVGALTSTAVAYALYGQGMVQGQLAHFLAMGVLTGLAALVFDHFLNRIQRYRE